MLGIQTESTDVVTLFILSDYCGVGYIFPPFLTQRKFGCCRSGGVANWVRDLRSLVYCLYLMLCLIDVFRAVLLHIGVVLR